jgi:UDP-N-acetylglucosamine:LPS N-acetylglucosamine transferase
MELNLAVHPEAAQAARRFVTTPVVATGPAISPSITRDAPSRDKARAELGLDQNSRVVLVVSGSWGVGSDFERTVSALVKMGDTTVFTMCGSDDVLRKRLEDLKLGTPVGWTDRMASYLSAADVVVENAGGLTANECFARGVPIVSYRAIPGHGRDNVSVMSRAGVTTVPHDEVELVEAVRTLSADTPRRREQVARAAAMFVEDPIERIVQLATASTPSDRR